jgi:predicted phage terminase large subunit-like protein
MEPLYHCGNPQFGAVIFRRTFPQITRQGGMWDQAAKIYPLLNATPNMTDLSWRFPSGSRIQFAHLQHEKNIYDWQGSEIPLIEFDELTHFTEAQFWYLTSRNRSTSGVRPYVRASCNPDADSWVAKLLEWWIDQETGLPIPVRAGRLRWFVRVDDELKWGSSREELLDKYPMLPPRSLTFVPARLSDNAALMAADPNYLATLLALPLVERERLLGGNWKIRPAAGLIFNRAWFELVEAAPAQGSTLRYWDKASTPGAGDWSAGCKIRRFNGIYYIMDVTRGQWSSADREATIKQTAILDGHSCSIWVEQEGGSGGKDSAALSIKGLAGFDIHAERVTGDKVTRARGLSAQAEAHNVKLVINPDKPWIGPFLDELHAFPLGAHDDQVDAASGSFNKLTLDMYEWGTIAENPEARSLMANVPRGVFDDQLRERDDRDRPRGFLDGMGDW